MSLPARICPADPRHGEQPPPGFEPGTCGLQNHCSTTELRRHIDPFPAAGRADPRPHHDRWLVVGPTARSGRPARLNARVVCRRPRRRPRSPAASRPRGRRSTRDMRACRGCEDRIGTRQAGARPRHPDRERPACDRSRRRSGRYWTRTPPETTANTRRSGESGAKSGALSGGSDPEPAPDHPQPTAPNTPAGASDDWQHDADLREVVRSWPSLPPPIRAAVLAMVRTVGGER